MRSWITYLSLWQLSILLRLYPLKFSCTGRKKFRTSRSIHSFWCSQRVRWVDRMYRGKAPASSACRIDSAWFYHFPIATNLFRILFRICSHFVPPLCAGHSKETTPYANLARVCKYNCLEILNVGPNYTPRFEYILWRHPCTLCQRGSVNLAFDCYAILRNRKKFQWCQLTIDFSCHIFGPGHIIPVLLIDLFDCRYRYYFNTVTKLVSDG